MDEATEGLDGLVPTAVIERPLVLPTGVVSVEGAVDVDVQGPYPLTEVQGAVGFGRAQLGLRVWGLTQAVERPGMPWIELAPAVQLVDTAALDLAPALRLSVDEAFRVGALDAGLRLRWPGGPLALRLGEGLVTWQLTNPVAQLTGRATLEVQAAPIVAVRVGGWTQLPVAIDGGSRFGGAASVVVTPLPDLDVGPRFLIEEYVGPVLSPGVSWTLGVTVAGRVAAWTPRG